MRLFIDTNNGFTFNGKEPFIFWFDNGQSTSIFYVKKIAYISDSQEESVSINTDSCFSLVDVEKLINSNEIEISGDKYYDLKDIESYNISIHGDPYPYTYNGNNYYLHFFYIICNSSEPGEYIDKFIISNGTSSDTYSVGADIYVDNEVLTSNLENLGIEIPSTVQKAIYESNIHEDATDNILMNRKWKELLIEYWNIVAKKGSYKSLLSSLKWFEYGDLVKIMEYWKRSDSNKDIFISNDIEQIMGDLYRKQLSVLSKTTYIGLYLALEKISEYESINDYYPFFGNNFIFGKSDDDLDSARINITEEWSESTEGSGVISDDAPQILQIGMNYDGSDGNLESSVNTSNSISFRGADVILLGSGTIGNTNIINEALPELYEISSKWAKSDLSLKMTVLGNFFATYFMPIHLDLIHSTIENICFANSFKTDNILHVNREDYLFNCKSIKLDTKNKIKDIYMQPITAYVDYLTILGLNGENGYEESPVLGYSPEPIVRSSYSLYEDINDINDINDFIFMSSNMYTTFGAPLNIITSFKNYSDDGDFINCVQINWDHDGNKYNFIDNSIFIRPEDGIYNIDFNILLPVSGSYNITITFYSVSGIHYSGRMTIKAINSADNIIDIYRVERIDETKLYAMDFSVENNKLVLRGESPLEYSLNSFMTSITNNTSDIHYSIFINSSTNEFTNQVGLNHTIILPIYEETYLKRGDTIIDCNSDTIVNELKENFNDYFWIKVNKYTSYNLLGELSYKKDTIIGLRKYFTNRSNKRILFKKDYVFKNKYYNIEINQSNNSLLIYKRKFGDSEDFSIELKPLTNRLSIDLFGDHTITVDIIPDYKNTNNKGENITSQVEVISSGRYLSEDRFVPLFHTLEPLDNYGDNINNMYKGQTLVAIPRLSTINTNSDFIISFIKCSNNKVINTINGFINNSFINEDGNEDVSVVKKKESSPIGFENTIINTFKKCTLEEGFYDIKLEYTFGNDKKYILKKGAFKVM